MKAHHFIATYKDALDNSREVKRFFTFHADNAAENIETKLQEQWQEIIRSPGCPEFLKSASVKLDVSRPINGKDYGYSEIFSSDFGVKMVFPGDRYGLDNCLTNDKNDILVEFYDRNSIVGEAFGKHGQFVSRYNMDLLLGKCRFSNSSTWDKGVNLHNGVSRWKLSGNEFVWAMVFASITSGVREPALENKVERTTYSNGQNLYEIYQHKLAPSHMEYINRYGLDATFEKFPETKSFFETRMFGSKSFDPKNSKFYSRVADVEAKDLEDAFRLLNLWPEDERSKIHIRPGYSAHSLSVGDIVVKDDEVYMVENSGFANLAIDPKYLGKYQASEKSKDSPAP